MINFYPCGVSRSHSRSRHRSKERRGHRSSPAKSSRSRKRNDSTRSKSPPKTKAPKREKSRSRSRDRSRSASRKRSEKASDKKGERKSCENGSSGGERKSTAEETVSDTKDKVFTAPDEVKKEDAVSAMEFSEENAAAPTDDKGASWSSSDEDEASVVDSVGKTEALSKNALKKLINGCSQAGDEVSNSVVEPESHKECIKAEVKAEVTAEVKLEVKPEVNPEVKDEVKA